MNEIKLGESASDPIEWAIRTVLCDEFDVTDLKFDQQIRDVVRELESADYLCELLTHVFSKLPNGKSLECEFSDALWKCNGTQTFADLHRFINENYDIVRIEPVGIFGQPCLPAGVFRALERIVHQIDPKVDRFAPSASITNILHGWKLRQLFVQVQLLTAGRTRIGRRAEAIDGVASALTLLSIPLILGFWVALLFQFPRAINPQLVGVVFAGCIMLGTALICLGLQKLYLYSLDRIIGVFPNRSYTFRDLARTIAQPYCNE